MSADASERFSAIQSEIYHHGYDRGYQQGRADELDKISKMILLGCDGVECVDCGYEDYPLDVCQQAFAIEVIKNYIAEQLKEQKNE